MSLDAELPCHGARAAEAEQGAACAKRFLASPCIECGGGSDYGDGECRRLEGKQRSGIPVDVRRKITELILEAKKTLKIDIRLLVWLLWAGARVQSAVQEEAVRA